MVSLAVKVVHVERVEDRPWAFGPRRRGHLQCWRGLAHCCIDRGGSAMGDCDASRPEGELRTELVESVSLNQGWLGGIPLSIKATSSCEVNADGACRCSIDKYR